jgi:para-nitrobenzyl esterase
MADGPVIDTSLGRVQGTRSGGVSTFKGIPYAGSVAGANRWKVAPPPAPWTGVRDATAFGAVIPQPAMGVPGGLIDAAPDHSEEHGLNINVWTPDADSAKRPVMVWISCGAFTFSNGGDAVVDGTSLATNQDVVVVTFNCRPGLLGFMYLGDVLGDEYATGNMGLHDQIDALRWVRENIAVFGGDPDNVTVVGCSGSGFSIAGMMSMPAARGLFRRAIIESGADFGSIERHHASEFAEAILQSLGIGDAPKQVLDVPVEQLLDVRTAMNGTFEQGYGSTRGAGAPVVDKVSIFAQPLVSIASGSAAGVGLLVGSNQEEMTIQIPRGGHAGGLAPVDDIEIDDMVRVMAASCDGLGGAVDGVPRARRLVEGYLALQPDRSPADVFNFMRSEMLFRIPANRMAEAQLVGGGAPVRMYLFEWGPASHGLEIAFAFDNLDRSRLSAALADAPSAQELATKMSAAWASFARTGDPGHPGIGDWPAFTLERRETMILDDECRVERDPLGAERALWTGSPTGNRTPLPSQIRHAV